MLQCLNVVDLNGLRISFECLNLSFECLNLVQIRDGTVMADRVPRVQHQQMRRN
jgi:hypothetical protein